MLIAEVTVDTGWAVGAIAIVGALGTFTGLFFKNLSAYRKTADAGKLALVEAEQASVKLQLEAIRQEALSAKQEAKEAREHAEQCDQLHQRSELDRAELRGTLAAGKEERDRLQSLFAAAIGENGRLAGKIEMLQVTTACDTSETLKLAEAHGEMKSDLAKPKNGGSRDTMKPE